jgi:hypothetical protein
MKKYAISGLLLTLCVGTVSLWAADFWAAKPFTDWTDKEAQKMVQNSPWAKEYSVAMPGGAGGADPSGKGGGGRSKGGGGDQMSQDASGGVASGASVTLYIRWQSATPIKQANVRLKYKGEAATSAEAKAILDTAEPAYIVIVEGLNRGMVRGAADDVKKELMAQTELLIKGREPIKPVDFRIAGEGMRVNAVFAFPKTVPITLDEKEVEFDCKVGTIVVKQKFPLKAMVFKDKLEL